MSSLSIECRVDFVIVSIIHTIFVVFQFFEICDIINLEQGFKDIVHRECTLHVHISIVHTLIVCGERVRACD